MKSFIVFAFTLAPLLFACQGAAAGPVAGSSSDDDAAEEIASTAAATNTPEVDYTRFSFQGASTRSILPDPEGTEFGGALEGLGQVLYHDGRFHMFYNDIQGGWPPARVLVGYATSDDGLTWTRQGDTGIFSADQVPYAIDGHQILAMSALVEEDGTWVMYFESVGQQFIGRATAPGPEGPWTADPEPALQIDQAGWDQYGIASPSVVILDGRYLMFYAVFEAEDKFGLPGGNPHMSISLATSEDGITWTKVAEPVFSYPGGESWDAYKVESPSVIVMDEGLVMLYRSDAGHYTWGKGSGYGIALSQDGETWTRLQDYPVFIGADIRQMSSLWSVSLAVQDGRYYLYAEADRAGFNGTQIYVATYAGTLLPGE